MPTLNIDFVKKLMEMAEKLRGNTDVSEYKHDVLGLLFLKYLSDSFDELYKHLQKESMDPEDRDKYKTENTFWIPKKAHWIYLKGNAKNPQIGQMLNHAISAIEKENESLHGVLPRNYARAALNHTRLGMLIELFSFQVDDKGNKAKDVLGNVFDYFLNQFAATEGTSGGEYYTPDSVVKLLVEMVQPYNGKVYNPCCGVGGTLVQSYQFVNKYEGKHDDIAIYGQESNPSTWNLAKMNLYIHGINANLGEHHADTFHHDVHEELKADYILANPPFNVNEWGGEKLQIDSRWKYGVPPIRNANYAWIQHIISKLSPEGTAGFVLANSSMSTNMMKEFVVRRNLIEQDLVDCIVTLPGQLFYSTQIPVCLWFVSNNITTTKNSQNGEILFIDARDFGHMVARTIKKITNNEIKKITSVYHAWRGTNGETYKDIAGFCKVATLEDVIENEYDLTPGRYVEENETKS